jgi:hypothetical protein
VSNQAYVVTKATLRISGRDYIQGAIIPNGVIEGAELDRFVKAGHIQVVGLDVVVPQTKSIQAPKVSGGDLIIMDENPDVTAEMLKSLAVEVKQSSVTKGKWDRDPASLESLDFEELMIAINEIDPTVDLADMDEEAARKLLSSDFHPVFQEGIANATAEQVAEVAAKVAKENEK